MDQARNGLDCEKYSLKDLRFSINNLNEKSRDSCHKSVHHSGNFSSKCSHKSRASCIMENYFGLDACSLMLFSYELVSKFLGYLFLWKMLEPQYKLTYIWGGKGSDVVTYCKNLKHVVFKDQ